MELESLIGLHKLSGVDFDVQTIKQYGEKYADCQVVNFVLDKLTYSVIEDPSDGYRSSMDEIKVSDHKVKNKFKPVQVLGTMREGRYQGDYYVLDFIDVKTAKIVLSVGTDNTDNYYPTYVCEWKPENLHLNKDVVVE